MTLTINLPDEVQSRLSREASRQGMDLPSYVVQLLSNGGNIKSPSTGSELVAYWQREGLIGTRPEIEDSPAHARLLRSESERRERS
jgi:hypothetical protein